MYSILIKSCSVHFSDNVLEQFPQIRQTIIPIFEKVFSEDPIKVVALRYVKMERKENT